LLSVFWLVFCVARGIVVVVVAAAAAAAAKLDVAVIV
jgi:hypothetical protein